MVLSASPIGLESRRDATEQHPSIRGLVAESTLACRVALAAVDAKASQESLRAAPRSGACRADRGTASSYD